MTEISTIFILNKKHAYELAAASGMLKFAVTTRRTLCSATTTTITSYDARITGLDDGSESTLGQDGYYRGEWDASRSAPHGRGAMTWDNGITYEGAWSAGKFHGDGAKLYSRGGGYEGTWVEGKRWGEGAHIFAGKFGYERWRGPFDSDQPHGVGVMEYTSGEKEAFEFIMGKPQLDNSGTHDGPVTELDDGSPSTFGVSAHYVGGWLENAEADDGGGNGGQPDGFGVMRWENGIEYKGMWRKGKYHGHGRKLYSRGGGYEGAWVDGKRVGHGISFFDQHAHLGKHGLLRWEGNFVEDRPRGAGQAFVVNTAAAEDNEDERWLGDTAIKGPIIEFNHVGEAINFP